MAKSSKPIVWDLGEPLLEIGEQSTAQATDALVTAVSEERWKELGLTFRKTPGDFTWMVRSSDVAGIARLDLAGESVHLRVNPKVEGLDLFFLADWAYGTGSFGTKPKDTRVNLAAVRPEPAACLLGWYVSEVLDFATRWLRRGYVVHEEELIGRVRGRINVARYIGRSLSQARPHIIPARFTQPSHDTAANRYLKAGLRRVAVLARSVPIAGARVALEELVHRALALFATVADVPAQPHDALRLSLSGPLRHYVPIVSFTTALLEGTYVSDEMGSHPQDAIMWSVNSLYEQALGNVLKAWPGASQIRGARRATVTAIHDEQAINGSTPVKPDYVIRRRDGSLLVLDAKYKSVLPATSSNDDESIHLASTRGQRIRVKRADIYQVVAYARHTALRTDKVALLYPIALAPGEEYPAPLKVMEFSPTCYLVFFDVGVQADSHRADLYEALGRI